MKFATSNPLPNCGSRLKVSACEKCLPWSSGRGKKRGWEEYENEQFSLYSKNKCSSYVPSCRCILSLYLGIFTSPLSYRSVWILTLTRASVRIAAVTCTRMAVPLCTRIQIASHSGSVQANQGQSEGPNSCLGASSEFGMVLYSLLKSCSCLVLQYRCSGLYLCANQGNLLMPHLGWFSNS